MTTYTDFTPSTTSAFQFQPTLDGQQYLVVVTWNVYGQRWYVNCYALNGTLVFCVPLVGSPPNYSISLSAGFFASTLVFRQASQQFEVSP